MQIEIEKILHAKHIQLVVENNSFALGSALYTYLLTLHKKVSICSSETLMKNLSFLPWYEKVRPIPASSAELVLEIDDNVKAIFAFLKKREVKINKKMATALYSALLLKYDFFSAKTLDGMVFAIASELIALGAEHEKCSEYLQRRVPLSQMRLKATLFKSLLLTQSAQRAELFISDDELKAAGACLEDSISVLSEVLCIVNVEEVILYKSDEENRIVKIIKDK